MRVLNKINSFICLCLRHFKTNNRIIYNRNPVGKFFSLNEYTFIDSFIPMKYYLYLSILHTYTLYTRTYVHTSKEKRLRTCLKKFFFILIFYFKKKLHGTFFSFKLKYLKKKNSFCFFFYFAYFLFFFALSSRQRLRHCFA